MANTKTKAVMAHLILTKNGELTAARRVFDLLKHKRVTLGLGDADWLASITLEKIGMNPSISSRTGNATFTF